MGLYLDTAGEGHTQEVLRCFALGLRRRADGVRLGTTFISRRTPSASAARDTESIVMVGLAESSAHPEMTCVLSRPLRRSMWSGDHVEKSPHEFEGASGVSVPFVR